jgi:hypothetical protein
MPAEIRIDLESLQGFIEATKSGAISEHKSIHYLLRSILEMGSRWRDPPVVIITTQDQEADYDEELADQLDKISRNEL